MNRYHIGADELKKERQASVRRQQRRIARGENWMKGRTPIKRRGLAREGT